MEFWIMIDWIEVDGILEFEIEKILGHRVVKDRN